MSYYLAGLLRRLMTTNDMNVAYIIIDIQEALGRTYDTYDLSNLSLYIMMLARIVD